jgi:hypothetical protein
VELAAPLDVDLVRPVDQDVGHRGVLHQGLDGTEAERLVLDLHHELLALLPAERRLVVDQHVLDDTADLLLDDVAGQHRQLGEIEPLDELSVHARLELVAADVRTPGDVVRGWRRRRAGGDGGRLGVSITVAVAEQCHRLGPREMLDRP